MPSLRELVLFGFCGARPSSSEDLGCVHRALDLCVPAKGETASDLTQESVQVRLASHNKISYANMPYFFRRLEAIHEHAPILSDFSRICLNHLLQSGATQKEIHADLFRAGNGTYLELVYDYAESDLLVPLHTIIGAYLAGHPADEPVIVRTLSLIGDLDETRSWPICSDQIQTMLARSCGSDPVAGPQCLSCPATGCAFHEPFEKAIFEYFELKKKVHEVEARLRQHLTTHGPTKVGLQIAFMQQRTRRSYSEKKGKALFEWLLRNRPDWNRYVRPDAQAIHKAVEKRELPGEMMEMFVESKYWTLETRAET